MLVGIVTISYNQAPFLREAIESVRLTDSSRLRYVIVDPGSADGSREIIARYERERRFAACILEPDDGPADGLNKGFAACEADIMGCLNADDRYHTGALDYVLNFFEANPEVDVLIGAGVIIDEDGRPNRRKVISTPFTLRRYLCGTHIAVQQATFFRRRTWERAAGFNPGNKTCWDGELLVDMALTGARFRTVNRILGHFRIHSDSMSGSGRMLSEYAADRERIRAKILAAGHPAPSPLYVRLARLWHLANPVRRRRQYTVT